MLNFSKINIILIYLIFFIISFFSILNFQDKNNPYIDKLILNLRKKSLLSKKSFYTPKGKQSAKDIIESIKNGLSVVLLIDQKDSAGEIVSFFNYPSFSNYNFLLNWW